MKNTDTFFHVEKVWKYSLMFSEKASIIQTDTQQIFSDLGSLKWTWTFPEHKLVNKENMTEGKSWTIPFFHQNKQQSSL